MYYIVTIVCYVCSFEWQKSSLSHTTDRLDWTNMVVVDDDDVDRLLISDVSE